MTPPRSPASPPSDSSRRRFLRGAGAAGGLALLSQAPFSLAGCKRKEIEAAEPEPEGKPPANAGNCPASSVPFRTLVEPSRAELLVGTILLGLAGADAPRASSAPNGSDGSGSRDEAADGSPTTHVAQADFREAASYFHLSLIVDPASLEGYGANARLSWRVRGDDAWLPLRVADPAWESDLETFHEGRYVTLLRASSPVRGVEARVEGLPAGAVRSFEILAEVPDAPPLSLQGALAAGPYLPPGFAAAPPDFQIIPRAQWNASPPKRDPDKGKWVKIVVHHTATRAPLSADPAALLRALQRGHFARDFDDLGYNFLVAPDGRVFEGRQGGKDVVGAHAKRVNETTVGVSFMGQFHEPVKASLGLDRPTEAALESGAKLVAWLALECGIDLDGAGPLPPNMRAGVSVPNLTMHTFIGGNLSSPEPTACPGNLIIAKAPSLKEQAKVHLAKYKQPASVVVAPTAPPAAAACVAKT